MSDQKVVIHKNYANIESGAVEKKPKKRVRYSVFFLTWNSNKPITDIADPDFQALEAEAETYWTKVLTNIKDYIIVLEGDFESKVKSVAMDSGFEIGSIKRNFHAHIYIRIDHYTKVRLNIDKIRTELKENMSCPGYINLQSGNDTTKSMENYIHKYNNGNWSEK